MIVVDASVVAQLLLGGDRAADAALLLRRDPAWTAPVGVLRELRHVWLTLVRRRALTLDQAKALSDDAAALLGGRLVSVPSAQVLDVALRHDLSAGDAELVALARGLGVPLATCEPALLHAAADVAAPLPRAPAPPTTHPAPPRQPVAPPRRRHGRNPSSYPRKRTAKPRTG